MLIVYVNLILRFFQHESSCQQVWPIFIFSQARNNSRCEAAAQFTNSITKACNSHCPPTYFLRYTQFSGQKVGLIRCILILTKIFQIRD